MKENIIFVDFFDTIMFREIHPFQIYEQWAENLIDKYLLKMSKDDILKLRNKCFNNSKQNRKEIDYKKGIVELYYELKESNNISVSDNEFYKYCLQMEEALEIGTHYPNQWLIKKLYKMKKLNVCIYILSDFHLGKESVIKFIKAQNIDINLFNDIIISADCNKCKCDGSLYDYVISGYKLDKSKIRMYGDNFKSDIENARKIGLSTCYRSRIIHKSILFIKRKINYDYKKYINNKIVKKCYKYNKPYSEYIMIFYVFIKRLYNEHLKDGGKLYFLAREGYSLKLLFEKFSFYIDTEKKNDTEYFLCSRRAVNSIDVTNLDNILSNFKNLLVIKYLKSVGYCEDECKSIMDKYDIKADEYMSDIIKDKLKNEVCKKIENNKEAFNKYCKYVLKDEKNIHFVDVGWLGTMQYCLENNLNIKTKSYYIGARECSYDISKVGLILNELGDDCNKYYSQLLLVNTQLYEELLSAPHGSVLSYKCINGILDIATEWSTNEKEMYNNVIKSWKDGTFLLFDALVCWRANEFSNYQMSKIALKSGLFADSSRIDFVKKLDNGFIFNFEVHTKGLKFEKNNVKIKWDVFYRPEKYARFAVKIQRKINSKILLILFGIIAWFYYIYVLTVVRIKSFRIKGKV